MLVNKPSSFHLALICAIFFFQINRWSLIAIYYYCFSFSLLKLFKFKKGFNFVVLQIKMLVLLLIM